MFIIDYILNIGVSKEKVTKAIDAIDTDRDGMITLREVIRKIEGLIHDD